MTAYPWSTNLLPAGAFETVDPEDFTAEGWARAGYEVRGLVGRISNVRLKPGEARRDSRRALELAIRTDEGTDADQIPTYQEHPIAAIESPPIAVKEGQFLRISVLVKMQRLAPQGGGGLIVRDSIGGEAIEFRYYNPIPEWKRVVLYRRAPEDGELTVTLGLANAVGEAFFDDLRIERVVEPYAPAPTLRPADVLSAAPAPAPEARPADAPEPPPLPTVEPPPRRAAADPSRAVPR